MLPVVIVPNSPNLRCSQECEINLYIEWNLLSYLKNNISDLSKKNRLYIENAVLLCYNKFTYTRLKKEG